MVNQKTTFALFFGNRGFFPASLIVSAREEMARVLQGLGHDVLMLDAEATRYGAVETVREGEVYARFLQENRGKFGGVILCLPNFGDENGAVAALKDAGVPILVQAYPDDLDKMSPDLRRDSFCGKISIMDVFRQHGVPFTALKPHTVSPSSDRFKANVDAFDRICRVVNGVRSPVTLGRSPVTLGRGMTIGALGARTTPFKTVRIDEIALQRHGITVETLDLSDLFARVRAVQPTDPAYIARADRLRAYTSWGSVPDAAFENLVRLSVTLDAIIEEYRLNAIALRCWTELQMEFRVSPCVLMGELNSRGIPAACEVDVGSAITMHALGLAADGPAACLDWNNNYGDEDDKCILFHCGPVPTTLMTDPGVVTDHAILATSKGWGYGYGCNVGRIAAGNFTFGNLLTDAGKVKVYLGQGKITGDPIPADFFGCAGVAEITGLQDVLLHLGQHGHRHHVAIAPGWVQEPVREAMEKYLGFEVTTPQAG
jgi:L-fucose isomerase-like protein